MICAFTGLKSHFGFGIFLFSQGRTVLFFE